MAEDTWNVGGGDFNWGDLWNSVSSALPKDSGGNTNWGGLLSTAGGLYQTNQNINAQEDLGNKIVDMTKFTPYNVTTNMGSSTFNPDTKTAQSSLSPALQQIFDSLLGKASSGISGINLDPAANTQNSLSLLRGLSSPEEARARTDLETRLLGQGRLGSTGGGIEQEALNKAQSNADLQRQLQAIGLGQQTVNNLINNSTGLLGAASQLGQVPNTLLSQGQSLGSAASSAAGLGADALYKTSQSAQDLRSLMLSNLFGSASGAGGSGMFGGTTDGGAGSASGGGSGSLGQLSNMLISKGINSGINYLSGLFGGSAPAFTGGSIATGTNALGGTLSEGAITGATEAYGSTLGSGSFGTGTSGAAAAGTGEGASAAGAGTGAGIGAGTVATGAIGAMIAYGKIRDAIERRNKLEGANRTRDRLLTAGVSEEDLAMDKMFNVSSPWKTGAPDYNQFIQSLLQTDRYDPQTAQRMFETQYGPKHSLDQAYWQQLQQKYPELANSNVSEYDLLGDYWNVSGGVNNPELAAVNQEWKSYLESNDYLKYIFEDNSGGGG